MPLALHAPLERVVCDDDWYEVRSLVGFADLKASQSLQLCIKTEGYTSLINRLPFMTGDKAGYTSENAKAVRESNDRLVGYRIDLVKLWLRGWSHDDPITLQNIAEMPAPHMDSLLSKIEELIALNQGVDSKSPLESPSTDS